MNEKTNSKKTSSQKMSSQKVSIPFLHKKRHINSMTKTNFSTLLPQLTKNYGRIVIALALGLLPVCGCILLAPQLLVPAVEVGLLIIGAVLTESKNERSDERLSISDEQLSISDERLSIMVINPGKDGPSDERL
ncbi:MAG: hypothetical protein ACRCU2_02765, partial [Planktothrix sp.]